jgi:alpha-N-acetylglucosaminidase
MFIQAWDLVIKNADSYKNSATYQYAIFILETYKFRYDLVDITSQALNLHALATHNAVVYAYNTKNYTEYTKQRDLLKEIIADVDLILGSNENFLLGNWIATARSWGTTDSEKAFLERNARLQITSWGPAGGTLTQYAYKMWASLVSDFYAARFQIWFDELDVAFDTKKPFDQDKYTKRSLALEAAWVEQTNQYPVTPSGDTIAIAQKIHSKYAELLYWV